MSSNIIDKLDEANESNDDEERADHSEDEDKWAEVPERNVPSSRHRLTMQGQRLINNTSQYNISKPFSQNYVVYSKLF